jgi:hypothetical protein
MSRCSATFWFITDLGWDRLDEDGRREPGRKAARPELRQLAPGARGDFPGRLARRPA